MIETIATLIGPLPLIVAALASCGYVLTVLLRERAGAEAIVTTHATTRPLLTGALTLVSFVAAVLIVLRLGVLS